MGLSTGLANTVFGGPIRSISLKMPGAGACTALTAMCTEGSIIITVCLYAVYGIECAKKHGTGFLTFCVCYFQDGGL